MAYGVILGLHIGAAIATIVIIAFALYALVGEKTASYRPYALSIGVFAVFQVASGTLLAALSPNISLLELAAHMVAYLIVCSAVELLLFERMRRAVWVS